MSPKLWLAYGENSLRKWEVCETGVFKLALTFKNKLSIAHSFNRPLVEENT